MVKADELVAAIVKLGKGGVGLIGFSENREFVVGVALGTAITAFFIPRPLATEGNLTPVGAPMGDWRRIIPGFKAKAGGNAPACF